MLKEIIIESNFATITYRTDGIIHIHYSNHSFTLEETKALFLTIRKNSPWEVSPFYITGDSFTSQDNESKKFNGSPEVTKHCSAIAIFSKSLGQKILANFYIKTIKPNTPTKFFTDEESAIKWLIEYI
jgi:hypothetical protein